MIIVEIDITYAYRENCQRILSCLDYSDKGALTYFLEFFNYLIEIFYKADNF